MDTDASVLDTYNFVLDELLQMQNAMFSFNTERIIAF